MSNNSENDLFAFREMPAQKNNGTLVNVTVSVSAPVKLQNGDWQCTYKILVDVEEVLGGNIIGVDGIQSLVLALQKIELELQYHKSFQKLIIEPPMEGRSDFGFWEIMKI